MTDIEKAKKDFLKLCELIPESMKDALVLEHYKYQFYTLAEIESQVCNNTRRAEELLRQLGLIE